MNLFNLLVYESIREKFSGFTITSIVLKLGSAGRDVLTRSKTGLQLVDFFFY
jgi:hypothetical protein